MNVVDRIASLTLRFARGRFAVFPDGIGNGDLARLVETIPAPGAPVGPVEPRWRDRDRADGVARRVAALWSFLARELPAGAR